MANPGTQLSIALRAAREADELSQAELAKRPGWSPFRIMAIEGGEAPIFEDELDQLLPHLSKADPVYIRSLFEEAIRTEPVKWFDERTYREHLNPVTTQMLEIEAKAVTIRIYQPDLIPGLVQTPRYTAAIVSTWAHEVNEERGRLLRRIRERRKNAVFGRAEPPDVQILIDRSVLSRVMGDEPVMREQLEALLDFAARPMVRIRVLHDARAGAGIPFGHFIVFDLDDDEGLALYRERDSRDDLDRKPTTTADYARRFENLWAEALDEKASADLIRIYI